VLFLAADTETGSEVNVALDHGSAQDVLDALVAGEDVSAEVEAWQVWGGLGA
jgi:urease accessory protein UreE